MARRRNDTADKGQFVSPTPLPTFMEKYVVRSFPDSEVTEYLVKRAAYIGSYYKPGHEDRLESLSNARWTLGASCVGEWKELVCTYYPPTPLKEGETQHSPTDDAKVKAHCLKHALSHLLELVGAPAIVASDLQILLSGYPVKELKAYSRAQRELLHDKDASYREIETKTGVDQSELSQAVSSGHLLDPWREGRR